jgi:hypothetical protein
VKKIQNQPLVVLLLLTQQLLLLTQQLLLLTQLVVLLLLLSQQLLLLSQHLLLLFLQGLQQDQQRLLLEDLGKPNCTTCTMQSHTSYTLCRANAC